MDADRSKFLTRSAEGAIAGVCKGLADRYGFAVGAVRLSWILAVAFLGLGLWVYGLLWICLPRADRAGSVYRRRALGVCARVARQLDLDPAVVRLVTVVLSLLSLGTTAIAYVLLWFLF